MDIDLVLRIVGLVGLGLGTSVFLLGGFVTSVAGVWLDDDRIITLTQFGPWVRGTADRDGGHEVYAGIAWFQRVWLSRKSHGERHLRLLGFQPDAIPVVEGAITARLRFSVQDDRMDGEFLGVRFDFTERPVKILRAATLAPAPRSWTRETF